MTRRLALVSIACLAGFTTACSVSPPNFDGYPCEASGACGEGYECDENTNTCVRTGMTCSPDGTIMHCAWGATDCADPGCRTCTGGTWSECVIESCTVTNGGVEIPCDGVDQDCLGGDLTDPPGTMTDCSACGDACTAGTNVATVECDTSGAANACAIVTCQAGWLDLDGQYGTGCEEACVPSNGGVEICDGADNDCSGTDDDMTAGEIFNDCNGRVTGDPQVTAWVCTAGACVISTCAPNFHDADGDLLTGCEYNCIESNGDVEACDGFDNDCNNVVDDLVDVTATCNTLLNSPVGVGAFTCTSGACAIDVCAAGFVDDNGLASDGCEANCRPDTPPDEVCDGEDNDCNGPVDDALDGATGCTTYYLDADHDGAGDPLSTRCMCAPTGDYTALAGDDCDVAEGTCVTDCSDTDGDLVNDCLDDCVDVDGDGLGDGAFDTVGCLDPTADSNDGDINVCADTDGDTCDDCSVTTWDPTDDGSDADLDTLCDAGDTCNDVDGDGLGDGTNGNTTCVNAANDSDDSDENVCADIDLDTCDDCTNGTWNMANDGADANSDGVCDAAPACPDTDLDGLGDGTNGNSGCVNLTTDSNDGDNTVCGDTDGDGCEDCSVASFWTPANDGTDTDNDTICDLGDACATGDDRIDTDGDGTPNGCDECPGNETAGTPCGTGICQACDGAGACVDDLTLDTDCGACQECAAGGTCVDQAAGSDVNNECPVAFCQTGACDGAGACGFSGTTVDCGQCRACDGAGACADDLTQDTDCGRCRECAAAGTCAVQVLDDDIKNECPADACNTGTCDGAGACSYEAASIDCGTCSRCDGSGNCVDELTQDTDCGACEECGVGGACVPQALGGDLKDLCTPDACNTGSCDGSGACGVMTSGTDCGVCSACDGSGACLADLAQDADCALCEECSGLGTCANQALGSDVKNLCTQDACNTGACDGSGACGFEANTVDCGTCARCDGGGLCVADLAQDNDCTTLCQECADVGTCQNQPDGSDLKSECGNGAFCDGDEVCGPTGACRDAADPCAAAQCDETGDVCGCGSNGDCGPCMKCVSFTCVVQTGAEDLKNDCAAGACVTGNCNGAGACGNLTSGIDCGVCLECDGGGACVADLTQDADCALCQECAAGGTCVNQGAASDAKNECAAGACTTGNCSGAGACGVLAAGTDCGTCRNCNAAGACNVDDLSQDADCPLCQECAAAGACANQGAASDVKNECAAGACTTGNCSGTGPTCGNLAAGTNCGVCRNCNAGGACNVDDLTQDADCPMCQECAAAGACVNQGAASDVKNECAAGACVTGNCNGAGGCGNQPAGTDCGACRDCNASGVCNVDDLGQDVDCPLCQECAAAGACANQGAGSDVKNECAVGPCLTGNCSGTGSTCGNSAAGTDCGTCRNCNAAGACNVDDLTQDVDCALCQECAAAGACANQGAASDVKNECAVTACTTGNCSGTGATCGNLAAGTNCGVCRNCNAGGVCNVDDLTQDADCPLCQECAAAGACANQGAGSDVKNECALTACTTGNCSGTGATCGNLAAGTDCGACRNCNAGGVCNVDDLTQDIDCPLCEECAAAGACANQGAGSDVKNECAAGACTTGNCSGTGPTCGNLAAGTDCGTCRNCNAAGACNVDDLTQDVDCVLCRECAAGGTCIDQGAGSDVKNECAVTACTTGNCSGTGPACGNLAAGTDCGTCRNCNAGGACSVDDLTQDVDCAMCQECAAAGACVNQGAGSDVKNECAAGACTTGNCSGTGSTCGTLAAGTDCGTCRNCDAAGGCNVDDLTQDVDCALCRECAAAGACVDQGSGSDVKNECGVTACTTGNCSGTGSSCGNIAAGTDCGTCRNCNAGGACNVDDLTQDADCGFCQECAAAGACANQAAGSDVKNECPGGLNCNGVGYCPCDGSATAPTCAGEANCATTCPASATCRHVACVAIPETGNEQHVCANASDVTNWGPGMPCQSAGCSTDPNDQGTRVGADCADDGAATVRMHYEFNTESPTGTPFYLFLRLAADTDEEPPGERYSCTVTGVETLGTVTFVFNETGYVAGDYGYVCNWNSGNYCWMSPDGNLGTAGWQRMSIALNEGQHNLDCDKTTNNTNEWIGFDGFIFTTNNTYTPDTTTCPCSCTTDADFTAGNCGNNWTNVNPVINGNGACVDYGEPDGTTCSTGGTICCASFPGCGADAAPPYVCP